MSSDAEFKSLPEETLTSSELPSGTDTTDNSYTSRTGQYQIPVQKDEMPVEDPINPTTADSDATLAADDKEAINQDNIIGGGRTRGAAPKGIYAEPGDEEGLPGPDDGTSRGAYSS
ncbi:hypothetical protein MMC14_005756 [Varicellaria rhodocarpa]|nr:hypothetical protein [Varicellaria rhodocarpa]